MIILALMVWYAVGVCSFIYWWTKDYDLESNEIPVALFSGFSGPLAFLVGFGIHSRRNKGATIWMKKRGKK